MYQSKELSKYIFCCYGNFAFTSEWNKNNKLLNEYENLLELVNKKEYSHKSLIWQKQSENKVIMHF